MADIHDYASRGDIQGVIQQLASGINVDYTDEDSIYTPLMSAARSNDAGPDMIRFLIEKGADVNAIKQGDPDEIPDQNALSYAIQSGNVEKIRLLADAGADVQYKRRSDYDALIDVMYGRDISNDQELIPLLNMLIDRGADPTGVSSYGESAVRVASDRGRFDAVKVLLAAGADSAQLKWTDLMFAVVFGDLAEVNILIDAGADLSPQDHEGRTAWLLSVQIGDSSKAQLLLSVGANRTDVSRDGKTAFIYAVESGSVLLVAQLIREGLELDVADRFERSPLMVAAEQGNAELVALLVASGAAVNAVSEFHGTALAHAASANAAECVRFLLENGADIDVVSDEFSPIIGMTSSLEIARLLLNAGADLSDIDDNVWRCLTGVGNKPLDCTREQYISGRSRRFGTSNPEIMNVDFWDAMIRCGCNGYAARIRFDRADVYSSQEAVWCHDRYGRSITELPDGRIIEIGGEHEDFYDPDFCIYNDVIVYSGDGTFTILGYPQDVFPPTDFHSATLVGDSIYIIGNVGYMHERRYGETPVYRLCCTTYQITAVETSGAKPRWISKHKARYQGSDKIVISGGNTNEIVEGEVSYIDNTKHYWLNLSTFVWTEHS